MVELQKNLCFMSVILKNKLLHCTQKSNYVFEAQDDPWSTPCDWLLTRDYEVVSCC